MTDLTTHVDALFPDWNNDQSPGAAVAIIHQGRVVYQQGYGMASIELGVPITPATVFPVASIAKQFTAAAIALLMLDGKLNAEDDIRQYLPELPDYGTIITVAHLIHHTSGIRDWARLARLSGRGDDLWTTDRILTILKRQQGLNFTPGTQFAYSNTGYVLLALIVARVTDQSLREFCQAHIFEPLGMHNTVFRDKRQMLIMNRASSYRRDEHGVLQHITVHADVVGDFNLYTTVADLARWDQNFYNNRLADNNPAFLDLIHRTRPLNDGTPQQYAFGLFLDTYRGLRSVHHSGSNAAGQAQMWRFPDQQLTVICLSNSGNFRPTPIVYAVADLLLADLLKPLPSPPSPVALPLAKLAAKTGFYRARDNQSVFKIKVEQGNLLIVVNDIIRMSLMPVDDNLFWWGGRSQLITLADGPQTPADPRADRVLDRLEVPQLTQDDLMAYTGAYTSNELATTYTLTVLDDALVVQHPQLETIHLQLIAPDQFIGNGMEWHFEREKGRLRGFTLIDDRASGLYFTR